MRHDRLLRSVAIGLALAVMPSAHAAKQTPSPKRVVAIAAKKAPAKLVVKVQKIAPAKKSDVQAARNTLELKIELASLVKQATATHLSLLSEHHASLNEYGSMVPIMEKGDVVLGVLWGSLRLQERGGAPRSVTVDELEKLGISGQKDFDRVVSERVEAIAGGIKGARGKDAQEILRKDMARTADLKSAASYSEVINYIRNYRANVLTPKGLLADGEHFVLAKAGKGSLVVSENAVKWQEGDKLRDALRSDFESVGIKTGEDFKRLSNQRLLQLMRIKGDPDSPEAMAKAKLVYERDQAEVFALQRLLGDPQAHADLALVAKSRIMLEGSQPSPIVLARNSDGEALQFAARKDHYYGAPINLVGDKGQMMRQATVADLRRFHIDSPKAFEALASQVLTRESK